MHPTILVAAVFNSYGHRLDCCDIQVRVRGNMDDLEDDWCELYDTTFDYSID